MTNPDTITVDGKQYPAPGDNSEAGQIMRHIRAAEFEIGRTQALLAIYQTARRSYLAALKANLEKGDTLKSEAQNITEESAAQ